MKISLLVGLKNNLDYTKHFYDTTRKLYPDAELCFVSYGSTDGTHEWLDSLKDDNLKYYYSPESKTFSDTFNKAAELATNEYVMYLHNDIVLAPMFLENVEKYVNHNSIVSYTTIEPPIFSEHERPGKIVQDFGVSLDTFEIEKMYEFVNKKQLEFKNSIEPGITFFMCIPKNILLDIGGLDNLYNPMFCEDDDLINRFKMLGLNLITSLDSICYHFVSKTSRFSDEYQSKSKDIEFNSVKNFIRKWGFKSQSKHKKKYDIGFVIHNCNRKALSDLEFWCDTLYIDYPATSYIEENQPNTKFNLRDKIKSITDIKDNNIILEFDATKMTMQSLFIIHDLADIIFESGDVGEFELDVFKITIRDLTTYEKNLIHVKV